MIRINILQECRISNISIKVFGAKMKKRGFTLVELMAVVEIIAILAVVLVPTVSGYIKRAKKTDVISQTRIAVNAVKNSNALGTGDYYIEEDAECCIVKDLIDSDNDEELEILIS